MNKLSGIINKVLDFLIRRGRTQVVLSYLGTAIFFIGIPIVNAKVDLHDKTLELGFETLSVLSVITLTIITIPVCMYLFSSKLYERKKGNTDLFDTVYIPYFEQIFNYLNIEQFKDWSYYLAESGTTRITVKQYNDLINLVNYIRSRQFFDEYKEWNDLMNNLLLLINDLICVLNRHLIPFGDNCFTIDKFYKKEEYNEQYNDDLVSFYKEIFLISDLTLELTRLCNYILEKIRALKPDFFLHVGVLIIRDSKWDKIKYQECEISNKPYPGLSEFEKIKSNRKQSYTSTLKGFLAKN